MGALTVTERAPMKIKRRINECKMKTKTRQWIKIRDWRRGQKSYPFIWKESGRDLIKENNRKKKLCKTHPRADLPFDQQNVIDDLDLDQRQKLSDRSFNWSQKKLNDRSFVARSFDQKKIQALIILNPQLYFINRDTTKQWRKKNNYFYEVLAGLAAQKRQHASLSIKKTNDSKLT